MSQEKVNKYKEQKQNRDKIMKKEKRILFLEKTAGVVVVLAIVAWLGYSVYGQVQKNEAAKTTETVMDATAIDTYFSDLQSLIETAE